MNDDKDLQEYSEEDMLKAEEEKDENDSNEPEDVTKVKFDPKDIDVAVKPLALYSLLVRIRDGRINMDTEFQRRGNLWSAKYQSRLIESVLLRLPLPSFYFDASDDDNWLVVDGLQRLSTLKNFVVDKKLKLSGLEVLEDLNGKKYDDLPPSMRGRIEEFQITVHLIKPGTPKEVKYDVFNRINTGGLTLKAQEIRHGLNQGNADDTPRSSAYFLKDLVYKKDSSNYEYNDNYKKYVNVNDKRMDGREMLLRYIAFYRNDWRDYKPSLLKYLNDEMEALSDLNEEKRAEITRQLWKACAVIKHLFGKHTFSKSLLSSSRRRMVNSSLFEIWTSLVAKLTDAEMENLKRSKSEVVKDFKSLLRTEEFNDAISISTASRKKLHYRFSALEELINRHKNA